MPTTDFGSYIRSTREAKGISLKRLAQAAGIDHSRLSKLERGVLPPPSRSDSRDLVVRLAQALNEDPLRLLQLAGHEPRPDVKTTRTRPPFRELILTERTLTTEQKRVLVSIYESWVGSAEAG